MNKDIDVRDVRAGGEVEIVVRRGVLVGLVDAVGDAARVAARVAAWDAVGDAARVAARVAARALVVAGLIPDDTYQTLVGPWASVISDPMQAVAP